MKDRRAAEVRLCADAGLSGSKRGHFHPLTRLKAKVTQFDGHSPAEVAVSAGEAAAAMLTGVMLTGVMTFQRQRA